MKLKVLILILLKIYLNICLININYRMFRTASKILILKNVLTQTKALAYKYPYENLILINSNPNINYGLFPHLKSLYLFNHFQTTIPEIFLTHPELKLYLSRETVDLSPNLHYLFRLPQVKTWDKEKSDYIKSFFTAGKFKSISELSNLSLNKSVQDKINYYNNWIK